MLSKATLFLALAVALLAVTTRSASASFHVMQVEQVIGGVDGSTSKQAIQLRMRTSFQNLMSNARLYAWDAAGANPVLLIEFPTDIAATAGGTRILAATSDFSSATSPTVTPDFVLSNEIPASYLDAGSITFEDDFTTVYWRVSWGGANYTGPTTGEFTNDGDGEFGPVVPSVLPSAGNQALTFKFGFTIASTSNANDYDVPAGGAVFFNSTGGSGTVQTLIGVPPGGAGSALALGSPVPNPVSASMQYAVTLPRDAHAKVGIFDLAGRRLLTLVDRDLPAGPHSFSWSGPSEAGSGFANGVYLLVLESEGATVAKRFILMR